MRKTSAPSTERWYLAGGLTVMNFAAISGLTCDDRPMRSVDSVSPEVGVISRTARCWLEPMRISWM